MKKILIALLAIAGITAQAQMKFNSAGNLETNLGDIYFKNSSGSSYGIGYGARGASEMVIWSDQYLHFRESDNNRTTAYMDFNEGRMWFYGYQVDEWEPAMDVNLTSSDANAIIFRGRRNNSTTFYIHSDGWIYSPATYSSSDSVLKEDITELTNSLVKVKKLKGYTYKYKSKDSLRGNLEADTTEFADIIRNEKQNRKRIGLIAQEVEKVIPDAVRTMHDGTKAICYSDLIAVLIEAVKEQQAQIELLEKEVKQCCKKSDDVQDNKSMLKSEAGEETTSVKSTSNKAIVTGYGVQEDDASLAQNNPNPFDQTTTIEMTIPETVADATVYVYDLNGTQKLSVPVHMRGATNVTVSANELEPGMYIYSLVTDGVLVGSKQMILTE